MGETQGFDHLLVRWQDLCDEGRRPTSSEVCADCPEMVRAFEQRLQAMEQMAAWLGVAASGIDDQMSLEDTANGTGSWTDLRAALARVAKPVPTAATSGHFSFLDLPDGPDCLGCLGSYRMLDILGQGGMGIVFKAEEPQPRRLVAVKVMRPERATPLSRQRFLREGQALASVEHERIVPVYRVDEINGVPFLVMPLLQGASLQARLNCDTLLPLTEVLRIGREVAEGLAAAHEAGLIHRDVKPSNIWLRGADARAVLVDFGLAREVSPEAGGRGDLTSTGSVLGTAGYMAPEQAAGQVVDARADLFSLGCVLYELATGQRPFTGPDPLAILSALVTHRPQPPECLQPAVPPALSALIMRLLAKSPGERPQSAALVVAAIRLIEQGKGDIATTTDMPLAEPTVTRRRHWGWAGAAAAVVAVAAFASTLASRAPLEVLAIDVEHYERLNAAQGQRKGLLGKDSFSVRLRDQVTIEARLSRPAYAYLLAFRPDGAVELCWPETDDAPPGRTDRPSYPSHLTSADERYGLREGAGLWVFAVVASDKPLPAYCEFVAQHKPSWSPPREQLSGLTAAPVWWYNGERLEQLTRSGLSGSVRGKGDKALRIVSDVIIDTAESLKTASHGQAIAAKGFEVRP